jgi:hypothetical protein
MEKMMVERRSGADDEQSKAAAVEEQRVRAAGAGGRGAGAGGAAAGEVRMRGRAFISADNAPLEHKTIEGIAVEGRKTTTVIPAGQVGNELPITITSEEWRSPELDVLILTRYSDPRSGESSYSLTNIIRAEPHPSLFAVPSDYTVKDTNIRRMEEQAAMKRRQQ